MSKVVNTTTSRRYLLKNGLGLTIAPAMSLLPEAAEAASWGPWHTTYGFEKIMQPLLDKYPKLFNSITKTSSTDWTTASLTWRNSASAMTKQGYFSIDCSSNQPGVIASTDIAFFQMDQYYDSYGHKDLVDGTFYIKALPTYKESWYSTEEFRRRRLQARNTNPMDGDVATIWNEWVSKGRPIGPGTSVRVTLRPNQQAIISNLSHISYGSGDVFSTGNFSFTAELVTPINGVPTMSSNPVTVSVDYITGGASTDPNWGRVNYVSLPFVPPDFTFGGISNWPANFLVSGVAAYRNKLLDAGNAYQEFADTEKKMQTQETNQAGWQAAVINAFGVGYAVSDGKFSSGDGWVLAGTAALGCAAYAFAYNRDRVLGNSSFPRLNKQVIEAMNTIIGFFGGIDKWNENPRNTGNFDLVALLQRFPRTT